MPGSNEAKGGGGEKPMTVSPSDVPFLRAIIIEQEMLWVTAQIPQQGRGSLLGDR